MIVSDATSEVLHAALRGLAQRQRVTADNMANIQTPGFLAGRVEFEGSLREAIAEGGEGALTDMVATTERDWATPVNTNGNNVNLDDETVLATETGLRFQLALNALDHQFSLHRTAIR